jgi:hypothetical protein
LKNEGREGRQETKKRRREKEREGLNMKMIVYA